MHSRVLSRRVSGLVFACLAFAAGAASATVDLFVAGPVDSLNSRASTAQVLGQTVALTSAQFSTLSLATRRASGPSLIEIVGVESPAGTFTATRVVVSGAPYVAGATPVALRARVKQSRPSLATLRFGNLNVDATAVGTAGVKVGDLVEVAGTQPASGGVLLATTVNAPSAKSTTGIIGSGTAGIIGSGTAGIIGSGTAGIIGSGTAGIIGSGTAGIIGSGTAGIIGSGTAGVIGSGRH